MDVEVEKITGEICFMKLDQLLTLSADEIHIEVKNGAKIKTNKSHIKSSLMFLSDSLDKFYFFGMGKEIIIKGINEPISSLDQLEENDIIGIKCVSRLRNLHNFSKRKFIWNNIDKETLPLSVFDTCFNNVIIYKDYIVKIAKWNAKIEGIHRELDILQRAQGIRGITKVLFTISQENVVIGFAMNKLRKIRKNNFNKYKCYYEIKRIMERLHKRSIYHGDIRKLNIMISKRGHYVLIDYDLASMDINSRIINHSDEAKMAFSKSPKNRKELDEIMLEQLLL